MCRSIRCGHAYVPTSLPSVGNFFEAKITSITWPSVMAIPTCPKKAMPYNSISNKFLKEVEYII